MASAGWLGLAAVAGAATLAWAGPLDKTVVDEGAKWVVHVDVEAVTASTFGDFIRNAENGLDDAVAKAKLQFGLDPLNDVKSLTIYGLSPEDEDGLVLVLTTPAADDLAQRLPQAGMTDFKMEVRDGVSFYSWSGQDQTWHLAVLPREAERMLVLAGTSQSLADGISVVNGERASLVKVAEGPLAAAPRPGSLLFVAATGLESAKKFRAGMLRQARTLMVDMGEVTEGSQREMYGEVQLGTAGTQNAAQIQQMLQGMLAFGAMMMQQQGHDAEACRAMQDVKVTTEGGVVTITCRQKSTEVADQLRQFKTMLEVQAEVGKGVSVGVRADVPTGAKAEKKDGGKEPANEKGKE
jgi:hypothetical protein